MSKKSKMPLAIKIFISLGLGICVGLLCMSGGVIDTTFGLQDGAIYNLLASYIKPVGDIFLNLLKFIVIPIVLLSIICGIISLTDIKQVWSIGIKTVLFYLLTTCIALIIGVFVASLFKGSFPVLETSNLEYTAKESKNIMQVIADFFPVNPIAPLLNANMLQIIVMALFIGFAIILTGEKAKPFISVLVSANDVFIEVMDMIIRFSPIGVFCLISPVVALNGPQILGSLAKIIGIAYLCYIIHCVLTYSTLATIFAKVSPFEFFRGVAPASVLAFSTCSSVGTLPVTIKCTQKLGAKKEIAAFTLPLGATINMDGTAIYQAVCTVFIASCYGINLTISQLATVVITATIASIGTAGVAGAGVVMLAMVLQAVGLPVEGIALVLGVDRIFDMGRTAVNVTGDAACAISVSAMETKKDKILLEKALKNRK